MSDTPTPSKAPTKRRGLALPPRGQALARLQDLERENESGTVAPEDPGEEQSAHQVSNAVNTASSNAVNHQGSSPLLEDEARERNAAPPAPAVATAPHQDPPPQSLSAAGTPGARQHPPVRAAREPTTRITVDMPDSLHRKISLLSVETRRTIKDLVLEALAATYFGAEADGQ